MTRDPTAQSGPLTTGQRIVATYESDMISEPCDLAEMIGDECGRRTARGILTGIVISVPPWVAIVFLIAWLWP